MSVNGPGSTPSLEPGPFARRAPGVEMMGLFADAGFATPQYLVRTPSGDVARMTPLLYAVLERTDGSTSTAEIAAGASALLERPVTPEAVAALLEHKLTPLGLIDGGGPTATAARPLSVTALHFRAAMLPVGVVRGVARPGRFLFWPPIIAAVLGATVAMNVWLLRSGILGSAAVTAIRHPLWALVLLGLVFAGTAFHEFGHASATRYGGAQPGRIGVGLYFAWPVMYTDVNDSYRLGRGGRIRTDLGGIYFNLIFALGCWAVVARWPGLAPVALVIVALETTVLQQFTPFVRLDGYYVIADAVGVPDLFGRIRPCLRRGGARELRPGVRRVVRGWAAVTALAMLAGGAALVVLGPRYVREMAASVQANGEDLGEAWDEGDPGRVAVDASSLLLLALPVLAGSLTTGLAVRATWARRAPAPAPPAREPEPGPPHPAPYRTVPMPGPAHPNRINTWREHEASPVRIGCYDRVAHGTGSVRAG